MWPRSHAYAAELETLSSAFREAAAQHDAVTMRSTSARAVEVLRNIALCVRTDQDYGLAPKRADRVGAAVEVEAIAEADGLIARYQPPYSEWHGARALSLRDALNRVAHVDPRRSSYRIAKGLHEILLCGVGPGGKTAWVAAISVIDICQAVRTLPDVSMGG